MSMHWYPRYFGDYMRDTGDLSMMEDGAYNRLLDHYYATGQPLPANASRLHSICRAVAPDEQTAVAHVIEKFFTLIDGEYHNSRASKEICKMLEKSEIRRHAAEKMHQKRVAKLNKKKHA